MSLLMKCKSVISISNILIGGVWVVLVVPVTHVDVFGALAVKKLSCICQQFELL